MWKRLAVRLVVKAVTSATTRRFAVNVAVALIEYLATKTGNDLRQSLVAQVREQANKDLGTPANLYDEIMKK